MSIEKMKFEALPSTVVPKVYDLTVDSDLVSLTFKGKVEVEVEVNQPTSEVVLNSLDLEVGMAVLCQGDKCMMGEVKYLKEEERIVVSFKERLCVGEAHLTLEFSGVITDLLCGYYRSNDSAHEGKFCALTQFEPTDARRAFPCWDEPALKAQFDISLIVDKELTALSNMNELSCTPLPKNDKRKVVKFARTPVMSTYLVAFSVGMYEYVERVDKNGTVHRVYGNHGKKKECEASADISVKALQFLSDFFNIKYPLPKCDHLAAQRFDHGAMENWGLVTYRASALFIDPEGASDYHMQRVHEIVSHELAHQWFGNLVTMQWWTDLWLNEGFASFMQHLVTDLIRPDFEMWTQFVNGALTSAITLDSLRSSHPVEVVVGHPSEVNEIFDAISYQKGCSLNRMVYFFLGKEKFTQGLTNYLNHFAYKNACTNDLWRFLGEAAGLDLQSMMTSWTRQTGFPMVSVEEMKQLTSTKRQFKLTQRRHLDNGSEDELNTLWSIPISVISSSSPKAPLVHIVMKEKSETIEVEGVEESDWVHLNPDFIGMYLVKYPKENIELLKEAVKQSTNGLVLSAESRSCILFEMLRLAISGQSSIVELLDMITVYKGDNHYLVWNIIVTVFAALGAVFHGSGCDDEKVKKYKLSVLEQIATQFGFEEGKENSHLVAMLRTLVLKELGANGHPKTVAQCRTLFEKQIKDSVPISVKLRETVLRTVARNTTSVEDIDAMKKLYKESSNAEEQRSVAMALGSVQTEELAKKSLEFMLSSEVPSGGDQVYMFMSFASSYQLGDFLLKYCEDNFEKVSEACGGVKSASLANVLKACTKPFYSLEQLAPADRIMEKHHVDTFKRGLDQNKETVSIRAAQIAREGHALKTFIDQF